MADADAEFHRLHEQLRTKIERAIELVERAIKGELPFGVVLFDGWCLAHSLIAVIEKHHLDWISVLKSRGNKETNSFVVKDSDGKRIALEGGHVKVQKLI